jgi:hypothetical protein
MILFEESLASCLVTQPPFINNRFYGTEPSGMTKKFMAGFTPNMK